MAVTDATCVTVRPGPDEARALLDLALQDLVAQPTSAVLAAAAQLAYQLGGPQPEQPSAIRQASRGADRRANR